MQRFSFCVVISKKKPMTRITFFIFIVLAVTITACKKSADNNNEPIDHNLTGKWIYTENGFSIGGPMIWRNAAPANQVIEFKANGTFIASENFLSGVTSYEKLDSITLKFQPVSLSPGYIKMRYSIDSADGRLYLSPFEPLCIEGCADRFVRKTK